LTKWLWERGPVPAAISAISVGLALILHPGSSLLDLCEGQRTVNAHQAFVGKVPECNRSGDLPMDIALRDLWLLEKVPGFSNEGCECLVIEATDFSCGNYG
jgi:hypothetical protein